MPILWPGNFFLVTLLEPKDVKMGKGKIPKEAFSFQKMVNKIIDVN